MTNCPACGHTFEADIDNIECEFTTHEFRQLSYSDFDYEELWKLMFGVDYELNMGGDREELVADTFLFSYDGVTSGAFEEMKSDLSALHLGHSMRKIVIRGYDDDHNLIDKATINV